MKVSAHALDRMAERVGVAPRGAWKLAQRALDDGITHADTAGSFNRFLSALFLRYGTANNMRVYGEHVYLFAGTTLVTVLQLPNQYKSAAAKLRRRAAP